MSAGCRAGCGGGDAGRPAIVGRRVLSRERRARAGVRGGHRPRRDGADARRGAAGDGSVHPRQGRRGAARPLAHRRRADAVQQVPLLSQCTRRQRLRAQRLRDGRAGRARQVRLGGRFLLLSAGGPRRVRHGRVDPEAALVGRANHRHGLVLFRVDGAGHPGAEPAGPGGGRHPRRAGQLPRGRRLARRRLPAVAQRQLRAPAGGRRPGSRGESRGGGGAAGEPRHRELAAADAAFAADEGLLAARADAQLRRLVPGLAEPRAVRRVLAADGQRRHEALRQRRRRAHPADRGVVRRVPGRHPGSARGVRRGTAVPGAPRHQRRRARQRVLAAHLCRRRRPRTGFTNPRRRGDDEVVRPARAGEGPRRRARQPDPCVPHRGRRRRQERRRQAAGRRHLAGVHRVAARGFQPGQLLPRRGPHADHRDRRGRLHHLHARSRGPRAVDWRPRELRPAGARRAAGPALPHRAAALRR